MKGNSMQVESIITQANCIDPVKQHYGAGGHVLRVFERARDRMIPIASFKQIGPNNFELHMPPAGEVWAEVIDDQCIDDAVRLR
jgi:hypothetical protein